MDRINSAGTILDANGHRIRQDKNIATGASGTELSASYDNDLQESLVAGMIEAAGETPTAGDVAQVMRCIAKLMPLILMPELSAGSMTIPANQYVCRGILWPGGGGGGGSNGTGGGGAGGGGGPKVWFTFPCQPGDVVSWSPGAAGGGGTGTPTNGSAGGTTTVSLNGVVMVQATGGGGGGYGNGALAGAGGSVGVVTSASGVVVFVERAYGGSLPVSVASTGLLTGLGGAPGGGSGPPYGAASGSAPGGAGSAYGAGGNGGINGGIGGNGASGAVCFF